MGAAAKRITGGLLGNGAFQKRVIQGAGRLAKTAVCMLPEQTEKAAVCVMGQEENKRRILEAAEQALHEQGICLKLRDVFFWQIRDREEGQEESFGAADFQEAEGFFLSREMEEELLDTIVRYLKQLLERSR